jgi:hypothetical protein
VRSRRASDVVTGQLRVHDPFELIRWLALSQPDPRKAVAELVQNSLDAGARSIRLTRVRERGVPMMKIVDDGEGVIPELDRAEALRYIATHVGHSRKRSLSPAQRLQLMTQGQYGIGLLGFWSLGEMLEIRTSLPGQRAHRLVLYRDRSDYLIEPLRGRLPFDELYTEVVVAGLHREAMSALAGRRIADYLGAELRGQILARKVRMVVEDRMSRGLAQKIIAVDPPRFLGERLEGLGPLEVPGHSPIRLEIYAVGQTEENGEATHGLALYAAGTLVAESFQELASIGLDHLPWTDPRLTGLVDFPSLRASPGSRRGVVPDEAAGALAEALLRIAPAVEGLLEGLERRREEELDRTLVRDLQRAFRDFYRQRPRYSMLPVDRERESAGSEPSAGASGAVARVEEPEEPLAGADDDVSTLLFEPGPLHSVRLTPSPLRVECGGRRHATALAEDEESRPVAQGVEFSWSLEGNVGALTEVSGGSGARSRVLFIGGEKPAGGILRVVARAPGKAAFAESAIEVVEELKPGRAEGIPEPELVDQPGMLWRSRLVDGKWQVNSGHREYRAIADRPTLKLRYLALLFAKEVVLRSSGDVRLSEPLEQLVEVTAYADRNLVARPGRRGRRPKPRPAEGEER